MTIEEMLEGCREGGLDVTIFTYWGEKQVYEVVLHTQQQTERGQGILAHAEGNDLAAAFVLALDRARDALLRPEPVASGG